MKTCPFCAEEIQDAAIKCKHCGEFLDERFRSHQPKEKMPWHFRTSFIVVSHFCAGPLALPLLWLRPRTSKVWKLLWTIIVLVLSYYLFLLMQQSVQSITEYYELIMES